MLVLEVIISTLVGVGALLGGAAWIVKRIDNLGVELRRDHAVNREAVAAVAERLASVEGSVRRLEAGHMRLLKDRHTEVIEKLEQIDDQL